MQGRVDGILLAAAAHDEARRRHRAGDDAQHAQARQRGTLAMYDGRAAVGQGFPPGEIMIVFDLRQRLFAQRLAQALVGIVVAGRGVVAGQVHGRLVPLAFLRVEREPGQVTHLRRQRACPSPLWCSAAR